MFEIQKSSTKVMEMIREGREKVNAASIYKDMPFAELEIGQSFAVDIDKVNKYTLRNYVSNFSKDNNVLLKMITHKNDGVYEIARIK